MEKDKVDSIEFLTLGGSERKLLLEALDVDVTKLKCAYCNKELDYKNCTILQPVDDKGNTRIVCSSPMCMIEYIEDYNGEDEE